MCGRFTVTTKDTKKVADRFQVELEKALERRGAGGAADALGAGSRLGEGPESRLPDDQREKREPDEEPRLRAARRQVPPPLPDRRRRLLRVDEGRGPQAAAPALALPGRRWGAVRLRRP